MFRFLLANGTRVPLIRNRSGTLMEHGLSSPTLILSIETREMVRLYLQVTAIFGTAAQTQLVTPPHCLESA